MKKNAEQPMDSSLFILKKMTFLKNLLHSSFQIIEFGELKQILQYSDSTLNIH